MMKLVAPFALVALALAAMPAGAAPPSYASGTADGRETIEGTIASLTGKYTLTVDDQRGFVDSVTLHDGTVITPTGTRLYPRQSVTIAGHADGKTFDADEIDVDPATIGPEIPLESTYPYTNGYYAPYAPDPYAQYYYGAPYGYGNPYAYGNPYYYGTPYYYGSPYYYNGPYYYTPNAVPNAGKQNYMPPPFWTNGSTSGGGNTTSPRSRQPVGTRPETHAPPPARATEPVQKTHHE